MPYVFSGVGAECGHCSPSGIDTPGGRFAARIANPNISLAKHGRRVLGRSKLAQPASEEITLTIPKGEGKHSAVDVLDGCRFLSSFDRLT
jgi:hypothetical protein